MSAANVGNVVPIEPVAIATRLPPFGREVADAVAASQRLNVYLYATSDAWDRARARRTGRGPGTALLLPPGEEPTAYRWPIVPNGVFIVAIGQSRTYAFNLARAVVSGGTPLAFAVFGKDEALIVRGSEWNGQKELAA